jgi:hypothetical protein
MPRDEEPQGETRVGRARVRLDGCSPERAERVSRLIFDHLQRMLARDCLSGGTPRVVAHLRVPSLEVRWEQMDDDAIARTGATWIYRWLQAGA